MDAWTLIVWAPALEVAAVGALVAVGVSLWVAHRARREGLSGWAAWQRALTVATLFLTIDLVVFGAFTRLTDSGLGCPDWPGCYGTSSPLAAQADIAAAHAAAPNGPVSPRKAWIEMVHRYLATSVGALITGLMVMGWWHRRRNVGLSPWWATVTFIWVCVQGAFGALTVTMKLQPIIVTLHLLGGVLGVALLTAQVRVLDRVASASQAWMPAWRTAALRGGVAVVLALVALQIALGGWVSTNYAVLACGNDVPTCHGDWWPDMDVAQGFTLWRPLGGDGQGGVISLPALTAIHMAHRLMALVVLAALALLAWRLAGWGAPDGQRPWRREAAWLAALALWQLLTGLSNVVFDWPLVAALGHTLGATLLVWRLVHLWVTPRLPLPTSGTSP